MTASQAGTEKATMRYGFEFRDGLTLVRTPSARQQAARRRLAILAAMAALALGGAMIGALIPPPAQTAHPTTGPFSYFPSD